MEFIKILQTAVQGYIEDCISGNDKEIQEVEGAWKDLNIVLNEMPNGIISYQETFFEISAELHVLSEKDGHPLNEIRVREGRMAISELASEYTRLFEHKYNLSFWSWGDSELDFFEAIDKFIEEKTKYKRFS